MTSISVTIDDSEVRHLGADLAEAPRRLQRNVPRAMRRLIGPKITHEIKQDASGHRFLDDLPRHASFEMLGPFSLEAGLEYVGQGKLAHIIVNGSVNNAPVYDFMRGPRRSLYFTEKVLADEVEAATLSDVQ